MSINKKNGYLKIRDTYHACLSFVCNCNVYCGRVIISFLQFIFVNIPFHNTISLWSIVQYLVPKELFFFFGQSYQTAHHICLNNSEFDKQFWWKWPHSHYPIRLTLPPALVSFQFENMKTFVFLSHRTDNDDDRRCGITLPVSTIYVSIKLI